MCASDALQQATGSCRSSHAFLPAMCRAADMEGGNLAQNLRAKKVTWWRRGKKVSVLVRWGRSTESCVLCDAHHACTQRAQIALDVARALVYLHSRRIIHLDIKSANVLLTR